MMKVQNKFLALCVAGLILATAASVLADTAGADAKSIYVMGVIAGENGKLQTADPFSTTDIYSLKTVVNYANVKPGVHVQQLKFISPEGALYQTVSTAFTGKRPRPGERVVTDGTFAFRLSGLAGIGPPSGASCRGHLDSAPQGRLEGRGISRRRH